mmetsp:Transcript_8688/g.21026  ORF Transcript_8688/g.21026 Transcript_8688/m.21026 type:complete len:200 (+) Transcript_8688:1731-2330(+)
MGLKTLIISRSSCRIFSILREEQAMSRSGGQFHCGGVFRFRSVVALLGRPWLVRGVPALRLLVWIVGQKTGRKRLDFVLEGVPHRGRRLRGRDEGQFLSFLQIRTAAEKPPLSHRLCVWSRKPLRALLRRAVLLLVVLPELLAHGEEVSRGPGSRRLLWFFFWGFISPVQKEAVATAAAGFHARKEGAGGCRVVGREGG